MTNQTDHEIKETLTKLWDNTAEKKEEDKMTEHNMNTTPGLVDNETPTPPTTVFTQKAPTTEIEQQLLTMMQLMNILLFVAIAALTVKLGFLGILAVVALF